MRHRIAAVILVAAAVAAPDRAVRAQLPGVPTSPLPTTRVGKGTPPKNEEITSRTGCTITDDAMDKFLKGLEVEKAQKDALAKEAAAVKSSNDYASCTVQFMQSPDGMALGQKYVEAMGNEKLTAEDRMKAAQKMGEDVSAATAKKCGPDPLTFNSGKGARVRAAEQAGAKAAGMDDDCYSKIKEFALAFCGLTKDQQQTAMTSGIKFPGIGNGQWVFTSGEAKAFSPRCGKLVPAIKAVSG